MHRKLSGLSGLAAAALVFSFGCQGSGSFAKLQESLAQVQKNQEDILKKLGELEEKVGSAPAAKPAGNDKARPQPGRPDPSATYKVDVGDAHFKGPADAKVTIVEWSDFQ